MIRRSSSKSRSSSGASDRRACQPIGRPACSKVRECHGPAHSTNRSIGIGGVGVNSHASACVRCPRWEATGLLDSTVQFGSATTRNVIGALRSTWSKQAKTRWVMSTPTYALT